MVPADFPLSSSQPRPTIRQLLPNVTLFRFAAVWITVVAFESGHNLLPAFLSVPTARFAVLFLIILLAVFGVVREADHLAHLLREPFSTLVLTFTVVSIEVILIAAAMRSTAAATIARDSIVAVTMIILNLVMGVCMLLGGIRFGEQNYKSQGAVAYLSMIVLLTCMGLLLPNVLSLQDGSLMPAQAGTIALVAAAGYCGFLAMQLTKYRHFFVQPEATGIPAAYASGEIDAREMAGVRLSDWRAVLIRSLVVVGLMLPIVLLAEQLGVLIETAVERAGLPTAMSGLIIAIIIFLPESITATKAALDNKMQRTMNLCLGAYLSTVGLTVPAILAIGLYAGKAVVLNLSACDTLLIALTLALISISFLGSRTSSIQGMAHVMLFLTYFGLMFAS